MNKNIHLIAKSILPLLLAIGTCVDLAKADVSVFVSAQDSINDQNTEYSIGAVIYNTGQGLVETIQSNGATISYSPADGLPGHQDLTAAGNATAGSIATATAATSLGLLHAYAIAGPPLGTRDRQSFSTPRIDDSITFNNPSSDSVPITVRWHIDGTLIAGAYEAYQDSQFDFYNGSLGGQVYSDGMRHVDPSNTYETYSVTGWDQVGSSYEVVPNGGDVSGLSFTGHCLLPPGQTTVYLTNYANIAARGASSVADFGNTAGLQIELPPDVTFTSASGGLLAGVTAVSRKSHRAAGDFDIDLPLTGNPGIECRKPGLNGSYRMVVTFGNAPTVDGPVAVTSGTGTVSNYAVDGQEVTINLAGVTNKQTISVTVGGVHNGAINGDVIIPMQIATGDVNGDAVVTRADVTEVQGQIGQTVTEDNFRDDVTADGRITNADVRLIKQSR